jgi:hypothetical protein
MNHSDHDLPAELHEVGRRLRDSRPELTALELDAIKRRVIAASGRLGRSRAEGYGNSSLAYRPKGSLMKSRLAVTMMLVLGLLMSGTGATLAVSGLSDSGSAGSAQYPDQNDTPPDVLADEESGTPPAVTPAVTEDVQPTRQVSSSDDDTLPFTGFLAIPVLLGGVALLGTGAALRRRSRDGSDHADQA